MGQMSYERLRYESMEAIQLTLTDLEIANTVEHYLALGGNGAIEDTVTNLIQRSIRTTDELRFKIGR